MILHTRALWLAKAGSRDEEYEDAWASDDSGRLAVSDGASDAFESRLLARALVQAFVRQPPELTPEALQPWLAPAIQSWSDGIRWEQLPWYAAEKARRGGFATLLGLILTPGMPSDSGMNASGSWMAMAIGDACMFHVREDMLRLAFPLESASAFDTTPPLISTRHDYNQHSLADFRTCCGEYLPGDLFLLATDALSAWFLAQVEMDKRPWLDLVAMTSEDFARWAGEMRDQGQMRNDDVTLLILQVSAV